MTQLDSAVAVVADSDDTATRAAVVEALLAAGARVVVPGAAGGPEQLTSYDGDLRGRDGVEALLEFAAQQHGRVDVVVLSTGEPADRTLADLDDAEWSAAGARLDTLLWGLRASTTRMAAQGSGRVVVLASAEAKVGRAGAGVAAALGHAAYGLVKVAAKEVGPRGVTVNLVMAARDEEGSLVGRTTRPAEVAAAVVLLASPAGGGMSAVAFPVDGGVSPY